MDSCSLRNASSDLECAYDHFFKQGGFPKFKAKGVKDSYKTNNVVSTYKEKVYNSIELDLEKRLIKLPKLKWVKIKGYRNKESINGTKKIVVREICQQCHGFGCHACKGGSLNVVSTCPECA